MISFITTVFSVQEHISFFYSYIIDVKKTNNFEEDIVFYSNVSCFCCEILTLLDVAQLRLYPHVSIFAHAWINV